MADQVTLSVRSELNKIIEELGRVRDAAQEATDSLADTGKKTGEDLNKKVKETETFFTKLRDIGRRTSDQLKKDFKSLLAINAIGDALKLSNQFRGTIAETISLSDKIRKLGGTFGIAQSQFSAFQSMLTKGMGEIGLSSEAATNALAGLAETPVRGQENLTGYAKTAGQLASFGEQKGQEAGIAKGLANVLIARGGSPNDMGALADLADQVKRVRVATGKGPAEVLSAMEDLFGNMAQDMRKKIGPQGVGKLAAVAMAGGPSSTKFLENFLKAGSTSRLALEKQGFEGVVTDKGLDFDKFQKASAAVLGRVKGDPRLAAATLGIGEDAEGFVRLTESLERAKQQALQYEQANESLTKATRDAMGFTESWKASLEKVKSLGADVFSPATQGATKLLNGASQSTAGSLGVVAGGGILAALLAGYGLRGVGGALAGTALKGAAAEGITGQKTVPVYVTNAAEIAAGGAASSLLGGGGAIGALKTAGKFGLAGAAIGAAAYGGAYLGNQIEKTEMGRKGYDKLADVLLQLINGQMGGGYGGGKPVKVELNKRELREAKQPTRGASYGPSR